MLKGRLFNQPFPETGPKQQCHTQPRLAACRNSGQKAMQRQHVEIVEPFLAMCVCLLLLLKREREREREIA